MVLPNKWNIIILFIYLIYLCSPLSTRTCTDLTSCLITEIHSDSDESEDAESTNLMKDSLHTIMGPKTSIGGSNSIIVGGVHPADQVYRTLKLAFILCSPLLEIQPLPCFDNAEKALNKILDIVR